MTFRSRKLIISVGSRCKCIAFHAFLFTEGICFFPLLKNSVRLVPSALAACSIKEGTKKPTYGRKTKGDNTMDNNMNQEITNGQGQSEKTFTQEQVNAIVGKRLSEQKATLSAELDQREQKIATKELELKAVEILATKGLPKELAAVLRYSNEEELKAAVEEVGKLKGTVDENKYKIVPNRLPQSKDYEELTPLKKAFGLD